MRVLWSQDATSLGIAGARAGTGKMHWHRLHLSDPFPSRLSPFKQQSEFARPVTWWSPQEMVAFENAALDLLYPNPTCKLLVYFQATQCSSAEAGRAAPVQPSCRPDPPFPLWFFTQPLFLLPASFPIHIYQASILNFYAVCFHLLLKMHLRYQAHHF